ncbi:TetR/AcrR family transcriptional regulator C-terminal domain-containing protein [Hamadaea sp.]|uniref:TetR/AcrR family transcriptional regulator n=1 Tax=Hamadaea sp. TaxID=2024425 RepID=UPI0025BEEE92|nr:TetR/AcrR family transcriptional regulator C-terminal domain-containing protein [Hamadaea sp.]
MDGLELLWNARPQPKRGPRPALTTEQIALKGIEIADAEGLAAVSMQRVAADLGYTKMSLYRYVPGKAELVALMADLAIGAPPSLPGDGWREQLSAWAQALLPGFARHPWAIEATTGPRIIGPNEVAWLEAALSALDGTGLAGWERMDVVVVLSGHVRTIATQLSATPNGDPERQFGIVLFEIMREHADRFPAVNAALTSTLTEGGQDDALDFGLARILDGIGALIATR